MSEQGLLIEHVGPVVVFTINRERRRNALNDATLIALLNALETACGSEARGLILRGAGLKAFSSGSDVKELAELPAQGRLAHTALGQRLADAIQRHPLPSIAVIEGYCLGGGLEMAMACDYRISGDNATFGLPEVLMGALPTWGGTTRLPGFVGYGRAASMLVFGRTVDAATALSWGLINEVTATGQAYDAALTLLSEFAGHTSANIVSMAKQLLNFGRGASPSTGLYMEYLADMTALSSEALSRGTDKFISKAKD